jgi:hypothetical protein
LNNFGNIWLNQCIYCALGIVFQNGVCSQICGPNQIYSNLTCNCIQGFQRVGKDCINIVNKVCGINQIYSNVLQACVCAQGYYDSNNKLNCIQCPNGSIPGSDGLQCVCSNSSQVWNSNNNLCQNKCAANQ